MIKKLIIYLYNYNNIIIMQYTTDYGKILTLFTLINVTMLFIININYITLFIYCNSISQNLIIFNDIYFQTKYTNINFELIPKFYPSYKKYLNALWEFNTISIVIGFTYACYQYWTTIFIDFNFIDKSMDYIITTAIIIILSTVCVLLNLIGALYYLSKIIKNISNNNNNYDDYEYFCWICDKNINKNKIVKKINCPCQEYFHPDCIDKYLIIHKNYCRSGHKIAKYEHVL